MLSNCSKDNMIIAFNNNINIICKIAISIRQANYTQEWWNCSTLTRDTNINTCSYTCVYLIKHSAHRRDGPAGH